MKTKALIQNDGWPWYSILLKTRDKKDENGRQFCTLWRLPYDVIHGIGLKLGFVFSPIFHPTENRRLIFASLKSTDAYPTMFNKTNEVN